MFFQSPLLPLICFVDCFGIRVWNLCDAGSLPDGETLLMNEATKFASLIVAQQDVLLYHYVLPVMDLMIIILTRVCLSYLIYYIL